MDFLLQQFPILRLSGHRPGRQRRFRFIALKAVVGKPLQRRHLPNHPKNVPPASGEVYLKTAMVHVVLSFPSRGVERTHTDLWYILTAQEEIVNYGICFPQKFRSGPKARSPILVRLSGRETSCKLEQL